MKSDRWRIYVCPLCGETSMYMGQCDNYQAEVHRKMGSSTALLEPKTVIAVPETVATDNAIEALRQLGGKANEG